MKPVFIVLVLALFASCTDNKVEIPSSPTINYHNLHNVQVDYKTPYLLDINKDGVTDFQFVATFAEGSGNGRLEFSVISEGENLVFANFRTPKAFNKYENITIPNSTPHTWTIHNPILISRIFTDDPATIYWEGPWKGRIDKYLGVKVKAGNNYYTGWVRITYSATTSKITINDCAISKNSGFGIQAGAIN
jgi:hypothetical protein